MANRSRFSYHINSSTGKNVLVILDLGGGMSATNNIENIMMNIADDLGARVYCMPVIYRDSEGIYDGVDFQHGSPFVYIGARSEADAVPAAARFFYAKRKSASTAIDTDSRV